MSRRYSRLIRRISATLRRGSGGGYESAGYSSHLDGYVSCRRCTHCWTDPKGPSRNRGRGPRPAVLVGVAGVEPTTSSSRTFEWPETVGLGGTFQQVRAL